MEDEERAERAEEDSLSAGHSALPLPVTCTSRVFAYSRHDRDPICIAPMKLLPSRDHSTRAAWAYTEHFIVKIRRILSEHLQGVVQVKVMQKTRDFKIFNILLTRLTIEKFIDTDER